MIIINGHQRIKEDISIQNIYVKINDEIKPITEAFDIEEDLLLKNTPKELVDIINDIKLFLNIDVTRNRKSRKTEYVMARQLYAYLAVEEYKGKLSLAKIGDVINKDHSSILYSCKTFKNYIATKDSVMLGTCKEILEYYEK